MAAIAVHSDFGVQENKVSHCFHCFPIYLPWIDGNGVKWCHLMWGSVSFEKTLMLGKIEGGRRRGQQRMRWLDGITELIDMSFSILWGLVDEQGSPLCCSPCGHKELDMTEWLNWTDGTRCHDLHFLNVGF